MPLEQQVLEAIRWNDQGLLPAIVQDATTREVLMLAYMNAQSLQVTLDCGLATFWSRSRQSLWQKGETSGNTQKVMDIRIDCDCDTLLVLVQPAGPACHTNARTCFYRNFDAFTQAPQRH